MSVRKGTTEIACGKNETDIVLRNLGEVVYSTVELNDSNLHLADGSVLSADGIYADFVNYMKDLYNNSEWTLGHETSILVETYGSTYPLSLKGMTFGGGTFICVGGSGYVSTSTDGAVWTNPTQVGTQTWNDITYGGGKFVAVGVSGYVSTSTDGVTWTTPIQVETADDWSRVTYGGGKFVAVGASGYVSTSTDGAVWTNPTQVGTQTWNDITYGDGKFVAVGASGYVSTSTDGVTWTTPIQVGTKVTLNGVAYGNGKFIAVGSRNSGSGVYTSEDGVTWTLITSYGFGMYSLIDIEFGNGVFVIVSYTYIFTSTDGVTWNYEEKEFSSSDKIKYGNDIFFIIAPISYSTYTRGSKAYNVVETGTLINNDGVLSGFSTSNYAKLPKGFAPSNYPWEIMLKVKTGALSDNQSPIGNYGGFYQNVPEVAYVVASGHWSMQIPGTDLNKFINTEGTYVVQANTTYWLRLYFTGSEYKLDYSTDGRSFTNDISVSSTNIVYQAPEGFLIGCNKCTTDESKVYPWTGSIDLNECYININNKRWWSGVTAKQVAFTTEEEWQETVATSAKGVCGKYAWVGVGGYSYSINTSALSSYGSPTFNEKTGVASGFTTNKYFRKSTNTGDTVYLKVKATDVQTKQGIFGGDMAIGIYNGYLGYNTVGGSGEFTNITQIFQNQDIYFKITSRGSNWFYVWYKFNENDNYISITDQALNTTLSIGSGYIEGSYYAFNGEIDLANSYFVDSSNVRTDFVIRSPIGRNLRLPRLVGIQTDTTDPLSVGDLVEAGIPPLFAETSDTHTHTYTIGNESAHTHSRGTWDIKGSFQGGKSGTSTSGVFSSSKGADNYKTGTADSYTISFTASKNWTGSTSGGTNHNHTLTINSAGGHRHNIEISGNLSKVDTVQPESVKVFVYIAVATMPKTTDITNTSTIQNSIDGKADRDLGNVTLSSAVKSTFRNLSLPSGKYIELALGEVGAAYTAPADGYFTCGYTATAGTGFMELNFGDGRMRTSASGTGGWSMAFLPVKRGDVIHSHYGGTNFTLQFFRFIYANSTQ